MNSTLKSYDPSTGELLGEVEITDIDTLCSVVNDAKASAQSWALMAMDQRVKLISQAFQSTEPYINELSVLLSQEMGKDIRRSTSEVSGAIYGAEYTAELAAQSLASKSLSDSTVLQYKPFGVVAVISPWNYPIAMACNLIVPALVAGNTVVFKPSEETPLIAEAFVEYLNQVMPDNVLQIVHGDASVGKALVSSDLNMIAFTGSMATGKNIMASAATSLKRLVMELGGNDPMIVMHDANIETAARFAVASSFENSGQMCNSTERIYVDDAIAEKFETRVQQIASTYNVGAWNESGVNIGPLINHQQHLKVMQHIQDAVDKGAHLLLGSTDQTPPYVSPTVLTDITSEMLIEQEETFGPVVAISRFTDIVDAISRSNDSIYGLGAVVFGGEGASAVAEHLEAGMIGINQGPGGSGDSPWVGAKQSGYGFHGSSAGYQQFAQVRVLSKRK